MKWLTRTERWLVIGPAVFAAAWGFFALGIRPAVGRIETLNRVIPEKQKELDELRKNASRYRSLQAGLDDLKQKAASEQKGPDMLTFLESTTTEYALSQKVVTMKQTVLPLDSNYCEITVEAELENLTLEQLVNFLIKIKSSNHFLRIKSLYAKKNTANSNLLDAVIQISTLKPNPPTQLTFYQ